MLLRHSTKLQNGQLFRLHQRIPCSHRQFHASRSHRFVPELLQLTHDYFHWVHSTTGLPWSTSILMTAALTRVVFLPLQYYSIRQSQRRNSTSPMLIGWRHVYQAKAREEFPQKTEQAAASAEVWVQARLKSKRKALYRSYRIHGTGTNIAIAFGFLPIWIVQADVLRRMASMDRTILSYFTGSEDKVDTSLIPPEPEFATEAFYWIPSLIAADPSWILPITFGIVQGSNIWLSMGKALTRARARYATMPEGIPRKQQAVVVNLVEAFLASPAIFTLLLIGAEIPVAVVLFLIGSSTTQLVGKELLKRIMKQKEGIEPAMKRKPIPKPGAPSLSIVRESR